MVGGYIQILDINTVKGKDVKAQMIVNEDGTLSHTPMSETWAKNRNHQLVKKYDTTPKKTFSDVSPGIRADSVPLAA